MLQPELQADQSREDLGLISQLILITAAVQQPQGAPSPPSAALAGATPPSARPGRETIKGADGGVWVPVVIGRRATAFLVQQAATLHTLLRATAPPFVPQALRQALLSEGVRVVGPLRDLRLPVPREQVGGWEHGKEGGRSFEGGREGGWCEQTLG